MSDAQRRRQRGERLIVGIDEAGYGPVLGPLVVSACMVAVPTRLDPAGCDLWDELAACTRRPPLRRQPKRDSSSVGGCASPLPVLVGDSKRLYTPARGHGELERSVLALVGWFFASRITGVDQLLASLLPPGDRAASCEPWHDPVYGRFPLSGANPPAPLAVPDTVRPRLLASRLLPAGELNRLCRATPNKASVAWSVVAELLQRARHEASRSPAAPLTVVIDRQGGRIHYGDLLGRAFPAASVRALEEGAKASVYRLQDGRTMEVRFHVAAEDHAWPVAVASMVSKYLREVMMSRLNGYFVHEGAGVRPTAGYHTDAQRFLQQTAPLRTRLGISDERFVRSR